MSPRLVLQRCLDIPEFRDRLHQMARDQILHPLRRFLPQLGLQLHFQDTVREEFLVVLVQLREGMIDSDVHPAPILAASNLAIPIILPDHGQLRIQTDAHTSVSWKLERGAVVEGSHHGLEFPREDGVLDFLSQLDHRVHFRLALLPPRYEFLELGIHGVLSGQEGVDLILLDREARFDRLFSRPILPVSLSFDEDL